ncbi:helix-turn-helix transcriptional regulator [Zhenhengia yiwuensis]|uniref:helix-turn-helix domain-containing protein n=1 Tax=Zhenhengia yiwuensis TaxID=2763666 RepID=UPI002A7535AE|nr:helix-turn-helix transcriptional regulator [Zhenhengia yiwuensis]MDY3366484.1 helix-turn-helix transcriptional regulator [Zhenhengia yiwuensis]
MSVDQNKEIGSRIKHFRFKNKMTQQQLANKIGKSINSIKKYESGFTTVPTDVLRSIAATLNIPLHLLIGHENCSRELIIAISQSLPHSSSFSGLDILSSETSLSYEELNEVVKKGKSLTIEQENLLFDCLKKLDQKRYDYLYKKFRPQEYYAEINPITEDQFIPILKNYIRETFTTFGLEQNESNIEKIVNDIIEFKRWKIHELIRESDNSGKEKNQS